jgi:hypothetical protein
MDYEKIDVNITSCSEAFFLGCLQQQRTLPKRFSIGLPFLVDLFKLTLMFLPLCFPLLILSV